MVLLLGVFVIVGVGALRAAVAQFPWPLSLDSRNLSADLAPWLTGGIVMAGVGAVGLVLALVLKAVLRAAERRSENV